MTKANARRYRSDALRSEALKILAVGLIALSTSACSLTYGIVAVADEEPEATGSIAPQVAVPLSPDLDEEDWRRAKAALAVALDPQGPGTQVSWDNPASTKRGSFTPTGAPFVKNDEICRDFAAHLGGPATVALQGTACRPSGGEWVIKDIKQPKSSAKS